MSYIDELEKVNKELSRYSINVRKDVVDKKTKRYVEQYNMDYNSAYRMAYVGELMLATIGGAQKRYPDYLAKYNRELAWNIYDNVLKPIYLECIEERDRCAGEDYNPFSKEVKRIRSRFYREVYTEDYKKYQKEYRESNKDYFKAYRQRRKELGLCLRCGKPVDDRRFVRCSSCRKHVEDWSNLMKTVNEFGKTGEWLIKQLLRKNLPYLFENYVLPNGKRIEFYWKGIGIDVTVTHSNYASHLFWSVIGKKIIKYSEYVDTLHIIVIEDKFCEDDYYYLNSKANELADNVVIYNYRDLCNYLPISEKTVFEWFDRFECGFKYLCYTEPSEIVNQ